MTWLWPAAWPLLLLAPVAAALFWWFDRTRAARLVRAIGERVARLAPGAGTRWGRAAFVAALLCAAVAMLQPLWGEGPRTLEQRGVDLVVCLDVSRSMRARDVAPDRLARAQREIRQLAERARGDRLALVVFAGQARLFVPLTRDAASFAELVSLASPLSVERGGTDLGAALETALDALRGASGDHEAILLLTDGEDHEGRGVRAAAVCARRGIVVHAVGFGSSRGAKIPVVVDGGETYLRDRSGREVVSAMDPASLRRVAERTGGTFVDALVADTPLVDLYDDAIAPMARKSFEARTQREKKNRYQWPLFAAFLFWMFDLCVSERKR